MQNQGWWWSSSCCGVCSSCTGPTGLPRPKKEPGRRRGALRRSSSRHSHGEREKKRWVFLSVFLCFCLSFFRSFFFAPSPFLLLLLLLLLLLFFASSSSSSLLGDQPFAAGTSSAWLHGARGARPQGRHKSRKPRLGCVWAPRIREMYHFFELFFFLLAAQGS